MLHTAHYPREIITERVVFTPEDHARIALCRGTITAWALPIRWAFYA